MSLTSTITLGLIGLCLTSSVHAQTSDGEKLACASAAEHGQRDRDEGHLLEARRELLTCARDTCPAIVRKSCVQWLTELEQRIPSVVLRVVDSHNRDLTVASVNVDGVTVALDGRPIPLDPGQHRIEVNDVDAPPTEYSFLAVEGETGRLVRIELQNRAPVASPAPVEVSPPPVSHSGSGFRVPAGAWILGGAGVLALGGFAYLAVAAQNDLDALQDTCAPRCDDKQTHSGRDKALAADITLGFAVAALAGGVVWTVLAQHADSEPVGVALLPLPGGGAAASLRANF